MSSFKVGGDAATAQNNLNGISQQATSLSNNAVGQGTNLLNTGGSNVTSGTNFFNTALNGNQASGAALMAPQMNQIRQANQNQLQAINTMMPRDGGRGSSLFQAAYSPTAQINSAYGNVRAGAANNLEQTGLAQQQLGTNLFGVGNQALGTGSQASSNMGQLSLEQQQMQNQWNSQLGGGLAGLAFGLPSMIKGFSSLGSLAAAG